MRWPSAFVSKLLVCGRVGKGTFIFEETYGRRPQTNSLLYSHKEGAPTEGRPWSFELLGRVLIANRGWRSSLPLILRTIAAVHVAASPSL